MQKEMGAFTQKLGESVAEAATRVGKGEDYNYAMQQYRKAMQLERFKGKVGEVVSDVAKKVAIGPGLGAGYGAVNKLTQ
jgi:hypothetical protein